MFNEIVWKDIWLKLSFWHQIRSRAGPENDEICRRLTETPRSCGCPTVSTGGIGSSVDGSVQRLDLKPGVGLAGLTGVPGIAAIRVKACIDSFGQSCCPPGRSRITPMLHLSATSGSETPSGASSHSVSAQGFRRLNSSMACFSARLGIKSPTRQGVRVIGSSGFTCRT